VVVAPANVVIRAVGNDERSAWERLWNGYLAFYKSTLAPGASRVHWLTQTSNAQARILYDQVADDSGFMQYRKLL
jgi:hypothetical protein